MIAAAGNDDRQPVSFPASDPLSIAVSALGRKGTYPADAVEVGDVMAPFATSDPDYYITAFSNVGPEIDLTGPGDGIISTFPGGYAVMDGTSMATPAATGAAARLLGTRRDPARHAARRFPLGRHRAAPPAVGPDAGLGRHLRGKRLAQLAPRALAC